jgi:formylglycine-generating enzyme required for sulfatase activity
MGTTVDEQRAKADGPKLCGAGPDHPMYSVSHDEATQFCAKLTASERGAGRLPASAEYRLPIEAQWEYACRAGTTTATAFGDSLSSRQANFEGDRPYNGGLNGPDLGQSVEVGRYSANSWGLHDMHGNVWEWCRDVFREQLRGRKDPEVTEPTAFRAYRGGAWTSSGQWCRSAFRGGHDPGVRYSDLGFRVALVESDKQ